MVRALIPIRPRAKSSTMEPRKDRDGYRKVLAVVIGQPSDQDVLAHAADLVRPSKGKLEVLYVIEIARTMPVDAEIEAAAEQGENVLTLTEQTARLPKGSFDANILQAREIGPAVVSESVSRGADAVVVGMPFGKRHGIFGIDRHVSYILEYAPCVVILRRDGPPKGEATMQPPLRDGVR